MGSDSRSMAPSLWKGLTAGLVAGLVATAAKSLAEKLYPPRINGEPEPPELLTERIAGHQLDHTTELVAAKAFTGASAPPPAHSMARSPSFTPRPPAKEGANFGLAPHGAHPPGRTSRNGSQRSAEQQTNASNPVKPPPISSSASSPSASAASFADMLD